MIKDPRTLTEIPTALYSREVAADEINEDPTQPAEVVQFMNAFGTLVKNNQKTAAVLLFATPQAQNVMVALLMGALEDAGIEVAV